MSLFISALGPSLEAFIKFKHSIGIQYSASVQWYLKSLDRYNFEHGNSPVLCKSLVVGWSIERSEPVSYTHLDVYKRQAVVPGAGPPQAGGAFGGRRACPTGCAG